MCALKSMLCKLLRWLDDRALQEFSALLMKLKRFLINDTEIGFIYNFILKINYIIELQARLNKEIVLFALFCLLS